MDTKNFEVFFDCGSSKIKAGAFNKDNPNKFFFEESIFFDEKRNAETEIEKIVSLLEKNTNEYLNDVNLMIDSPNMLSIGLSISKKLDGSLLKKDDIQFLIQDAKQQILRNYFNQSIIHIIIKNYKIDKNNYTFLPDNMTCNLISLDIIFICIPKTIIEYFKERFLKLDISINQIFSSSYARSINYKNNFPLIGNIAFIDIGLNKTSITCFEYNEIIFFDIIPVGSNHISKDISKILKISIPEAENIKLNFDKDLNLLNEKETSLDLIQQIIFARIEEILELSSKSIRLNSSKSTEYKMILMGNGSRILDNRFKEKISFSQEIDLLEESLEDICKSGFNLFNRSNKQEVVIIPKKSAKTGFFEKLFHFFN
jgi:cell division protein FtsA